MPRYSPDESGLEQSRFRRNSWAFALDMGLWQIADSMVSGTTVLPAFVATLTQSELLIGLASGLRTGGWLLPQLLVASYVVRLEQKRPFMVRMALLRGPIYLPVAVAAWLLSKSQPGLTLGILLFGVFAFFAVDAAMSVPFFDVMAQGLSPRRRGRVQGLAAVLGGVGGIGAGVLVKYVLDSWAYPLNYAALFAMGAFVFLLASIALSFVQEAPQELRQANRPSMRGILRSLPEILRRDAGFRWMIIARIVSGYADLASTFYIIFAIREVGLPMSEAGLFVSAQVAGLLVSGLLVSVVQDRFGPRAHLRMNILFSVIPPALTLLAANLSMGNGIRALFVMLFFLLGIVRSNMSLPYMNWIIEHASNELRPLYVGVTNTLAATLLLAPVLGGLIVQKASYPAVFITAMLFALTGLVVTTRVPCTRGQAPLDTA